MSKSTARPEIEVTSGASPWWAWSMPSKIVVGSLVFIGAIVLFYAVENSRGQRAWEICKQSLAVQGAVPDKRTPATNVIPDRLNVFKAPGMSEWFLSQVPNELTSRLNGASRRQADGVDLIKITVVGRTNEAALAGPDLCLDYDPPLLGLATATESSPVADPAQVIPLIMMEDVPLSQAIQNLARQEGRKYVLDSDIISSWEKARLPEPTVSFRWANISAFKALTQLLENYNLEWRQDLTNQIGHISTKTEFSAPVQWTPSARAEIQKVVAQVSSLTSPAVRTLKATQGFFLYHQDDRSTGPPIHPARITIRCAEVPSVKEVEAFFPGTLPRFRGPSWLRALPSTTNTFRVFADPPRFCSAEDYLAQTDPWKPEFDLMREALKRPYARIEGNYGRTLNSPPRSYVSVRIVSQALGSRAQAYLLLGQPEQALRELTLLHDLSAVVEAQPLSLVSAMIEAAITGLYVGVIHDGLRLGVWRDQELGILQGQLEKIHLAPLVADGLSNERWAICRTLETSSPSDFADAFDSSSAPQSFWEKLKRPGFSLLTFGPTGWRYQSMAACATMMQSNIACLNRVTQTLRPADVEGAVPTPESTRQRRSPRTAVAWIATPNFSRAWQATAQNQTSVDHAFIACALERFRLARGEYPQDLASLTPGFADRIPRAIIDADEFHYRRLNAAHFTLYCVGWSKTDKGTTEPGNGSPAKGAWVWN